MNTLTRKIRVGYKGTFFDPESPITVQVFEDELRVFCNHAGHHSEETIFNPGMDNEYSRTVEVCDKCPAWSLDGEVWHE